SPHDSNRRQFGVMSVRSSRINRRGFLQAGAAVAWSAVGLQLVAACGTGTPASSSGGAPPASTGGGKLKLPTSVPIANLPKPDLPGTPDGLVMPGYQRYPTNLVKS